MTCLHLSTRLSFASPDYCHLGLDDFDASNIQAQSLHARVVMLLTWVCEVSIPNAGAAANSDRLDKQQVVTSVLGGFNLCVDFRHAVGGSRCDGNREGCSRVLDVLLQTWGWW